MTFLQTNQVMNNLFTATEIKVIQKSMNDENTIGTLGNLTYKTIDEFDKMIASQVGKVVLFVWVVVLVLIAFLLVFFVVKLTKKGWAEAEQRKRLKELDANRPEVAF
jgi:beta-lactamase regulating signal transducer with metallopeptidase domain